MTDRRSSALQKLIKTGEEKILKDGEIFQSSDQEPRLNIVVSGYVERYRLTQDNGRSVQSIFKADDFFPLTPVFKLLLGQNIYEGPETYYYSALSKTVIYSLDAKTFVDGVQKNPELLKDLLFESGKRFQSNIVRLENLALPTSYHRVAHYLSVLARQSGEELPRGILIRLPVTQRDISENLSLGRDTIAKAVRRLRDEGLITGSGQLIVLNLEKLEQVAYSS